MITSFLKMLGANAQSAQLDLEERGQWARQRLSAYLKQSEAVDRVVRTKRPAPHSGEVNFYYGLPRQRPSQV